MGKLEEDPPDAGGSGGSSCVGQGQGKLSGGMEDDASKDLTSAGKGDENDADADLSFPIKVPIVGFETMEERAKFTIFKLRVENDKLDETWLVFRRYTDFVRLHSKLKEEVPSIEITIPPKRWLRDNFETVFLEERMKGLQAFVDSILVHPKLVALPTIRKFFCLDEPPVYSDTAEETQSWCGIVEDSAIMLRHKLIEKEREIELLRTELALITMQKDNLLKTARNCRNCCQKQIVFSCHPSQCSSTFLPSASVPSSGSSSEQGSPRHRGSLTASTIVLPNKSRKSSRGSVHSETDSPLHKARPKRYTNGSTTSVSKKPPSGPTPTDQIGND